VFQTEAYARVLFVSNREITADEIDERVAERMQRKSILTRVRPPTIHCLIDEGALRRPVGGPEVMREQLENLVEVAQLPHVTVQVVPYGPPCVGIAQLGAFNIGDMNGTAYIAWAESQPQGSSTTDRTTIARLSARYDAIRADAHNRQVSIKILEDVMKEWR
jgi:hypothetical protein